MTIFPFENAAFGQAAESLPILSRSISDSLRVLFTHELSLPRLSVPSRARVVVTPW